VRCGVLVLLRAWWRNRDHNYGVVHTYSWDILQWNEWVIKQKGFYGHRGSPNSRNADLLHSTIPRASLTDQPQIKHHRCVRLFFVENRIAYDLPNENSKLIYPTKWFYGTRTILH
jgi:hypothetical protein